MRDASVNPIISGNNIMEVLINDQITAPCPVCGAASVTATILVDPAGVVFDSRSNALVAGAKVTLIDVTGNGQRRQPGSPATVLQFDGVTPAPSSVTTGSKRAVPVPASFAQHVQDRRGAADQLHVPVHCASGTRLPPGRRIDPAAFLQWQFHRDYQALEPFSLTCLLTLQEPRRSSFRRL